MFKCKSLASIVLSIISYGTTLSQAKSNWKIQSIPIQTRWASDVIPENVLPEYPRPKLVRNNNWQNLNGLWDYAITDSAGMVPPIYQGKILVPFSIESAMSGVQKALLPSQNLWYRRIISKPVTKLGERILLNFGAVDWKTIVFVNGKKVGEHRGGYTSFSFDITDDLKEKNNELVVRVFDPTDSGINPHGKQTLNPENIYYTACSGIWQTVWLETVPLVHIRELIMTPNIDNNVLTFSILSDKADTTVRTEILVTSNGKLVAKKTGPVDALYGIKINNARLWSPEDPFLYNINVRLIKNGKQLDKVNSYFGMRKISIQKDEKGEDRIFLNNKPYFNLGTLDQGYWPDGLYTPPTDAALKFDLEAIKAMGFNTVRKHIKIEPARWYYLADKIGLLVWQDFVNPPHSLPEGSKAEFEDETKEIITQLYNYTCIISWVLFNERWGAYDQQRLTEWVKNEDPSRIINGHTGELLYVNGNLRAPSSNPYISSDITDVHCYPNPMLPIYIPGKAMVCGEFGGVGVAIPGHQWNDLQGWGYVQVTPEEFEKKYSDFIDTLKEMKMKGLSGSIYTEPFDVEGEENGLITYDREIVKIPIGKLNELNNKIKDKDAVSKSVKESISIKNVDIANNYSTSINDYNKGRRDSFFLRNLTIQAIRVNDQGTATKVGNSYISILKNPMSKANLIYIQKITRTSNDSGVILFKENQRLVNSLLGSHAVENKIMGIINNENIVPFTSQNPISKNWDSLECIVISKYGGIGEEKIWGERMIYYLQCGKWESFGKYYIKYYDRALSHSRYNINNVTWKIFLNIADTGIINYAINVSKYNIENFDRSAESIDTYANLLYKSGKSHEAINWELKAIELDPSNKLLRNVLRKMKSGEKTW